MRSVVPLLFTFISLFSPVLSDPAFLSFTDCFNGNVSQKLDVSSVYGQLIEDGQQEPYLNLTVIGSTPQRILDTRDDGGGNLATLFTTTTVLTLEAWSNSSRFCESLRPASPLPSANDTTRLYCPLSPGDFAFSSKIPWGSDRALTTLSTRLSAVDPFSSQLVCIDVQTTPLRPDPDSPYGPARIIIWGTAGLAIAYWLLIGIARIVSAWNRGITRPDKGLWERAQSAGYIIASAISGERFAVTPALLRFCTPSMRDIIFHTQWCAVLSMVAVRWPAFVYPLLTQTAWATLSFNVTLATEPEHRWNPLSTDPYNPPSGFSDQLSDSNSPLYIDPNAPNFLFTLPDNTTTGMSSFAYTIGVRPEDLFGICLILFLGFVACVIAISLLLWFIDYVICFISGIVSGKGSNPMKLAGSRSPAFASRDMLDTVPNPNAEESKSLNGRDVPGIIRPPSRFTLTANTTTSAPKSRKWWRGRTDLNSFHGSVLHGNLVRLLVLFHLPITVFSAYEMTLPQSRVSVASRALAALSFTFLSILIPTLLVIRVRLTSTNKLYDETRTLLSLGPLYNHYAHGSQMFASMFFATNLVFGVVVGAGQNSGTAQAIVILVTEVVSALVTSIWLPWGTGASMGLISFLFCVARIVVAVLLVILSPAISIDNGPGGWVSYGILIILALIYLALALMFLIKVLEALVRIFGGVGFDRSRHVVDSGLLGACGLMGCCGSRRPHHHRRRTEDNRARYKAAASGPRSTRDHESDISSYMPPTVLGALPNDSRKGSLHSGPPPSVLKPEHALRPYQEEADDETGFIMGAWQPFQSQSSSGYIPMKDPAPQKSGFSRVGGGRAHIDTPYAISGGPGPSAAALSPSSSQSATQFPTTESTLDYNPTPSLSSAQYQEISSPSTMQSAGSLPPGAMLPFHVRTKSQTAIVEDASVLTGHSHRQTPSNSTMPGGASRPPSRTTRLDSAPPPSSYNRRSTTASDDDASTSSQPRKKPWYLLRRHRPHSSEGYSSGRKDEENLNLPDPLEPLDTSTTSPGKSFVVIRKGQQSPARSQQAIGSGSSPAGPSTPAGKGSDRFV